MKKALAVLMLAAMILSTGCGNQAQDAAKEAQQKVEQTADAAKDKANEVKDAASQAADATKDAANKAAEDAAAKVDEAKDAASQVADATKDAANKAAEDAAAKVDEMKSDVSNAIQGRAIALNGLMPGASVEDVQAMFGEATKVEGNVMTFADGLNVVLDGANKVKSISTTGDAFETPEGMYVGASEYSLNDNCGPADSVRKIANGAEYEYDSGDKKSKVVYKAENGIITEITCTLK